MNPSSSLASAGSTEPLKGEIAEVVLEGREAGNDPALDPEGGHPVRDDLLGVGDDLEDRSPQRLECAARLLDSPEVLVNVLRRTS